jgi:hypothetical protein
MPGRSLYSISLKWGLNTIAVTGITFDNDDDDDV